MKQTGQFVNPGRSTNDHKCGIKAYQIQLIPGEKKYHNMRDNLLIPKTVLFKSAIFNVEVLKVLKTHNVEEK